MLNDIYNLIDMVRWPVASVVIAHIVSRAIVRIADYKYLRWRKE